MTEQSTSLQDALDTIKSNSTGSKISLGEMVEALKQRGFGTLLIGPALITALPTGAIPGVPAVCGLLIFLITAQIAWGREQPWIPDKLKEFSFSREQFINAIERFRPWITRVDSFFHPRFEFLVNATARRFIAGICAVLGLGLVTLGFIPGLPMLLGFAILLFGLGLSIHDGLLTAFASLTIVAAAIWQFS